MLAYPIRLHDQEEAQRILESIDVEPCSVEILSPKSQHLNILIKSVKTSWANIIKQEMLGSGGDAAISRSSYACKEAHTDVLMMGNISVLKRFVSKMRMQPDCFKVVADEVEKIITQNPVEIKIGQRTFDLSKDFIVIGILNVTPDSFSDGGKFNDRDSAMRQVEKLLNDGATVIDVGGESTRPDSMGVMTLEEMDRVIPIIEAIDKEFKPLISIDSNKPDVIEAALLAGATLVNDVSSGNAVMSSVKAINKWKASAIVMMNLTPNSYSGSSTEEDLPDVIGTFMDFCISKRQKLMEQGISNERLIFDPGIGFGLSDTDIGRLLKNMYSFTGSGLAVCSGLSRKSCLGRIIGLGLSERDALTNAISLSLMGQGVRIFRTHDAKGLADVIKFYKSIEGI